MRRAGAQALQHPIRPLLESFLAAHPGARLGDLAEVLGLESSSLLWHLRRLESHGLVHRLHRPHGLGYYAAAGGVLAQKLAIGVASLGTPLRRSVLAGVLDRPGATVAELAQEVCSSIAPARVATRRLEAAGLVTVGTRGRMHAFHPAPLAPEALRVAARLARIKKAAP